MRTSEPSRTGTLRSNTQRRGSSPCTTETMARLEAHTATSKPKAQAASPSTNGRAKPPTTRLVATSSVLVLRATWAGRSMETVGGLACRLGVRSWSDRLKQLGKLQHERATRPRRAPGQSHPFDHRELGLRRPHVHEPLLRVHYPVERYEPFLI